MARGYAVWGCRMGCARTFGPRRSQMPTAEFDLPAGHADVPPVPQTDFPEQGRPEDDVFAEVQDRFARNTFDIEKNFAITYSGIPSSISRRVEAIAPGRFFVE